MNVLLNLFFFPYLAGNSTPANGYSNQRGYNQQQYHRHHTSIGTTAATNSRRRYDVNEDVNAGPEFDMSYFAQGKNGDVMSSQQTTERSEIINEPGSGHGNENGSGSARRKPTYQHIDQQQQQQQQHHMGGNRRMSSTHDGRGATATATTTKPTTLTKTTALPSAENKTNATTPTRSKTVSLTNVNVRIPSANATGVKGVSKDYNSSGLF